MPPSKSQDLMFGLKSEENIKSTLEQFFGCGLKKTDKYASMDFVNEPKTIYIELKTRRIRHNQYPTALIGKNKVDFCEKSNAKCYFVYVYVDGVFYIEYKKELFDTFECSPYQRGMREGGIQPLQDYIFIPHEQLTLFPVS